MLARDLSQSKAAKLRSMADYMREARLRKAQGLPPPNRLDKYRERPIDFITEGLGQCIGDSWRSWRIVLKAAFGFPLDGDELEFFREVAGGRDPPPQRVRELWLIIGRRGGKDSIASMIAVNAARYADSSHLRPGETALVACLATDLDKAGIVFRYVRGYFEQTPDLKLWLKGELPDSTHTPIPLVNRTEIRIAANNYRAPRGYPIACAIFDELAFWPMDGSANPDSETYRAMIPGMETMPNSMLVGISSAYRKKGLLYEKWKEHYGRDTPDVLVILADTRKFNPLIPQASIDKQIAEDPEAAAAEWLSRWREDLADYVDRAVVEANVRKGIFEVPPQMGVVYEAFVDPSGGSRDSFTLSIGHSTKDRRGSLDCIREIMAPFQPSEAVKEHAETLKKYRVRKITGDRYAALWPVEAFAKHGIVYEQSAAPKSDLYRDFLPLLNSRLTDLLDHPRMINQICALERRTARGGRDSIDHPDVPGIHDDVANAVAGVMVKVTDHPSVSERWRKTWG